MEGYMFQLQKLWKTRTTGIIFLTVTIISLFTVVEIQNLVLLPKTNSIPLLQKEEIPILNSSSPVQSVGKESESPVSNSSSGGSKESLVEEGSSDDDDVDLGEEANPRHEFVFDVEDDVVVKKDEDGRIFRLAGSSGFASSTTERNISKSKTIEGQNPTISNSSSGNGTLFIEKIEKKKKEKEKEKQVRGILSMLDMDSVLTENRASPESMKPRWHSEVDSQIQYSKAQIEKAPVVMNDPDLYAPVFRNLSMFKRSYELMEEILKVYIYKEGDRPIFHKPYLTGIYASEGWFMKQMQESKHFAVDDPSRAHLFYLPFGTRTLEEKLYVAGSHSYRNLIQYLRDYVGLISSKYPFWNRTDGRDHFMAGCHDWATNETRRSMETAIRALCNSDVREGFQIGKDVSLPETYVISDRDPLRSIGGKPATKRTTLAFFAGQMHGYLRPILVQQWQNKDPDMVISGPIPRRIKTKKKKNRRKRTITTYPYMDYMKDSKYCICPRGFEVNSPRVVESIFYGCVPVIISDNFVPPLFEVLDWSKFAVVVAEKEVGRLKEVLVGISDLKYRELERGVRGVRKHFLWNKVPVKYDLFHMVLHSVWVNRLYR